MLCYQAEVYGDKTKFPLPHSLCLLHAEGGRSSGETCDAGPEILVAYISLSGLGSPRK